MNGNKLGVLAQRLVDLAAKLKEANSVTASSKWAGIVAGDSPLGLFGEDVELFERTCGQILQECNVGDKFSEHFVSSFVRDIVGQVSKDKSHAKAEGLLKKLVDDHRAYQKKNTTFVPLVGLVIQDSILTIGQVSIRTITKADVARRLGRTGNSPFGDWVIGALADKAVAEFSVVAEPARAKELAIDETRRAIDILRYAIPFVLPGYYRELGVNVGIAGDFVPHGDDMAVTFPSGDDLLVSLSSAKEKASFPFTICAESIETLRQCGALDVAEILAKPVSMLTEFERVLLRGIHWCSNALVQTEPENELLSLTTCLEAFLTPRDNNPIGTAIAEGVALLLGSDLADRKVLKKKVKELYNKRSGVSHGGEKAVREADLSDLRGIVQQIVHRMISLRDTMKSQRDLLEWIEEKKLG